MSMISDLVYRLRKESKSMGKYGIDYMATLLMRAAGTIEMLSEKVRTDRLQGEWVPFEYGDERWHKCTACGVADRYIEYVERSNGTTDKLVAIRNYCPNCGARMKGAGDETD